MSRRVDPTSQGKLQGAINSIRAISGMIGPLLFTQVLALAISPSIPIHFPGASYFLAAVLLFSSLLLAVYVTRPSEAAQAASEPTAPLDSSD
jgi:MFS transporter, DHA1 family, tetracycline resistance protein